MSFASRDDLLRWARTECPKAVLETDPRTGEIWIGTGLEDTADPANPRNRGDSRQSSSRPPRQGDVT